MYDMVDPLPGALRLRMPGFVTAWSIVDLVMTSLRTLELPFITAALLLMGSCMKECSFCTSGLRLALYLELGFASAITFFGLMGNSAMICRRHWSLGFSLISHLLTLASFGILVWQAVMICRGLSQMTLAIVLVSVSLFILLRTALLVFNFIAFFKAKAFFLERDGF